jgi:predicted AAA+ superfamily ATPase
MRSSAPGLTIHGIKYLVGRIFVFNLFPLSFEEFLRFKDDALFGIYIEKRETIKAHIFKKGKFPELSAALLEMLNKVYDEYIIYGGYPRVAIAKSDEEKKTVLKNIYSTYFLREIKDILVQTTDFKLSKLIKALSLQPGGLISYNSLSEVSGFDHKDLLTHLNILEKTFICKRVPPFYTNKRTEIIKVPKIYFFDSGFRNTIIDDFRSYELRPEIGQLNENFIFSQLTYAGEEVKFWRSKAKAEVDFILDKERLIAIESKSGGRSETRSLKSFKEKYKPNKTVILCREKLFDDEGTLIMPFVFTSVLIEYVG